MDTTVRQPNMVIDRSRPCRWCGHPVWGGWAAHPCCRHHLASLIRTRSCPACAASTLRWTRARPGFPVMTVTARALIPPDSLDPGERLRFLRGGFRPARRP